MTYGDCRYVHWLSGSADGIVKVQLVERNRKEPELWDVKVADSSIPGALPMMIGVPESALHASHAEAHQALAVLLKRLLRDLQPDMRERASQPSHDVQVA